MKLAECWEVGTKNTLIFLHPKVPDNLDFGRQSENKRFLLCIGMGWIVINSALCYAAAIGTMGLMQVLSVRI